MLDFIRNNTKLLMVLLFLLVIPSFVLFGIEGYTRYAQSDAKVARVDGHGITQAEWDAAHRREVDNIRATNPNVDIKLLDSPLLKYAALERLVRERVLAAAVSNNHIVVSDARLADELGRDPAINALRKPDGTLDMDRYKQLLSMQGMTPEGFEAGVRTDLASRQVLNGVAGTGLASSAQAELGMDALNERREVQIARFEPAQFVAKVNLTDAEVEAYYKANLANYQAPEMADIQYLVLDLDAIKKTVTVSEQDLKTYYDQNAASLGTKEQRRASHILIAAPKGASQAERDKAKARAEQLLTELRAAPDKFADVAKKESQDDTTAAGGGDLGFFDRAGIDPAIADAAFKLDKGAISGVVASDFGYHIIRLTDIKPAVVPPFAELRAKLEDQLKTQQAQRKFTELAEDFRNRVYEQADSLEPAAEKLGLKIQTANGVTRTPAPGAKGALASPKFLSALFAADSLEKKHNTDAIEVAPSTLASGRVTKYVAAHAKPFDDVKADVRKHLTDERAAELARKEGAAKLAAWRAQPASATGLPAAITISRTETHNEPSSLVEAVMRADATKLPQFTGVDLGAAGYAVARVAKVLPTDKPSADTVKQDVARYEQLWGSAEVRAYYEQLRERFKAEILVPKPANP